MWFDWSKRAHRGLRTWITYILKDSPKSGVEIMDAMEAMSQGWWRPSPGSVYPMLESMTRDGLIRKAEDTPRSAQTSEKKYELTELGKQEADWPTHFRRAEPRTVEEVVATMSHYVSYLEDLSGSKREEFDVSRPKVRELADRLTQLGRKLV